ncbi:hypothetical protein HYU20_03665 [Candidatus Woesearchaeota archaeon]|nr:hypothetical protein [Candidatus Woesearchaeota archaeon]
MQETQNENMPLSDMKEKLRDMRKRLMTFEWDKSHNQLNSSMEMKYSQIKTECEALQKKVDGMHAELKEQEAASTPKLEPTKAAQ